MFVVNFVLSFFATIPLATRLARVADHSLYSDRLYHGFDLFAFIELAGNPEVSLWSKFSGSILFSVVFAVTAVLVAQYVAWAVGQISP